MAGEWGPLDALIGDWEAEGGLDSAFPHSRGEVLATPYQEKLTLTPFGPVDNGRQSRYGLDDKSAMWRGREENPFHTEVGDASTLSYDVTITAHDDGTWSYDETTMLRMDEFPEPSRTPTTTGCAASVDAAG